MSNTARAALLIIVLSFLATITMVIIMVSRGDIVTESHLYIMSILAIAHITGHAGFLYHTRR